MKKYLLIVVLASIASIFAQGSYARDVPGNSGDEKSESCDVRCARERGEGVIRFRGFGAEHWYNEVSRLERALEKKYEPYALYALRLASTVYEVPLSDLHAVAKCESQFRPWAKNPNSTASGLMQFLDSTWASTRFSRKGFSVWDPIANALAAAEIRRADGSWRQWTCKP